jgi:UDP-3-O-[3-hydroxymyristoyl] glucosamine N-acyltransferase
LNLGNYLKIQAQSGISKNLKDYEVVQGSPAFGYSDYNKSYVYFKNLPNILKEINQIIKKLDL